MASEQTFMQHIFKVSCLRLYYLDASCSEPTLLTQHYRYERSRVLDTSAELA